MGAAEDALKGAKMPCSDVGTFEHLGHLRRSHTAQMQICRGKNRSSNRRGVPLHCIRRFAGRDFSTMSYSSENELPAGTRIADIREIILLLGYKKLGRWISSGNVSFESYDWREETDYKSWSGVELSINKADGGKLSVSTRTPISRS